MSEITARIDTLLSQSGKKRVDLLNELKLSPSTYRQWILGSIPNSETLYNVSLYLGVSLEYLITGNETSSEENIILSAEEKLLISHYRKLKDHDKNAVDVLARGLDV